LRAGWGSLAKDVLTPTPALPLAGGGSCDIASPQEEAFMIYALICTDKPDSLAIRKANRPEHLAYLESLGDTLVLAGPFTEPDGETMNGSLVVVEASSLDAARKIAAGDPFAKAGLFAHVDIRPWLWTINNPDEEE
jgi:uncharacterized protein YciI